MPRATARRWSPANCYCGASNVQLLTKGTYTKNPRFQGEWPVDALGRKAVQQTIAPIAQQFSQPETYFRRLSPDQAGQLAMSPNYLMLGSFLQTQRPDWEGWIAAHNALTGGLDYTPERLASADPAELENELRGVGTKGLEPTVAKQLVAYGKHVMSRYGGDVTKIWNDNPDYPTLHKRLSELPYFGEYKKAPMAADILARFGYVYPDDSWNTEGDPSLAGPHGVGTHPTIDSHVARHFARMMTADPQKQNYLMQNAQGGAAKYIVPFARALHRDPAWAHPGWWEHAQTHCTSGNNPACGDCAFAPAGLCSHGAQRLGLPQPRGWSDAHIPSLAPKGQTSPDDSLPVVS